MPSKPLAILLPVLLIGIAATRLVHLDADPGFAKSIINNAADVGDEGYWAAAARNLALFQTFASDDYLQAATSPFYTVLGYAAYSIFGVSMYTTRLPNAVMGIVAVLLVYRMLESYSRPAALVAGLTLAVENNFFIHTRMGQVEAACGFFALLAFYFLTRTKVPLLAGLALGLSIATKIVALLLVPAFVLFFALQWIRQRVRWRDVFWFGAGLGIVGAALLVFMQSQGLMILRNPFGILVDFVTGYNVANPTHYGDVFTKNLVMQSQGVAIVRNPARVLIDFVTGYYMSYPTIALLVVLLAAYAVRARAAWWVGAGAVDRVRQLTDVEIAVVSWLIGYAAAMIFLSDMFHRRMNLFTIPLAFIPGLLVMRSSEQPGDEPPRGLQIALLCVPAVFVATLTGRKVLEALIGPGTARSLVAAAILSIVAAVVVVRVARRWSGWWRYAEWVALMACVTLASMSLVFSLPARILPNLDIVGSGAKIAVVLAFLAAMAITGVLARNKPAFAIAAVLVLSIGLDLHDVLFSTFTARDASRRVAGLTTANDFGVGDGAHVLSLDAPYHAIQAYPGRGVNRDIVAKVKPHFLFRETDHRDKRLNDLSWTYFSITENDLRAIGASRIDVIGEFPLYPVRRQAGEVTYRLYRVTY